MDVELPKNARRALFGKVEERNVTAGNGGKKFEKGLPMLTLSD